MAVDMEVDGARSAVSNSNDLVSSILAHCSLQQRSMASTACRLWRSVATAPQFWENVDFSLYPRLGHAQVRSRVPARSSAPSDQILPYGVASYHSAAPRLGLLISHHTELLWHADRSHVEGAHGSHQPQPARHSALDCGPCRAFRADKVSLSTLLRCQWKGVDFPVWELARS